VVLLPDGVRNYMTKFLDDNWLADRDIIQIQASTGTIQIQASVRHHASRFRHYPDPGEYNPEGTIQIQATTIMKTPSKSRRVQS
jgi:hypothetical protein